MIVNIPSAIEIWNRGGNSLVQSALIALEPYLRVLYDGSFTIETCEIVHKMYAEEVVQRTLERVIDILEVKGWKARVYEENDKSWLEISQPAT
jgi:hypothetical protein